jgi:hypothetical protein
MPGEAPRVAGPRRRGSNQQGAEEMQDGRTGTVNPGELPGQQDRGERAGFACPGLQEDPGNLNAPRRVLADRRRRHEAVLVIGRPFLVLVSMDQDLGQIPGVLGFVAVPMVMKVRSRQDEPRPHRGGEEQKGGGEQLPYTHGAHCDPGGT